MPRRKKLDLKNMSIADLIKLCEFVNADANRQFRDNSNGRKIVLEKISEIENELRLRIYGCNPFISKESEE